jgi:hypothetical protein
MTLLDGLGTRPSFAGDLSSRGHLATGPPSGGPEASVAVTLAVSPRAQRRCRPQPLFKPAPSICHQTVP